MTQSEGIPFEQTPVPEQVPGICLRNTVVFPLDVVSVPIDHPRSIRMVEANPGDGVIVGCFFPADESVEEVNTPEDFMPIGVACRVIHRMRMPNESVQVVLQGLRRIRLQEVAQAQPYLQLGVESVDTREPRGADIDGLIYRCMEMVDTLVKAEGGYPPEMVNILRMNIAGAGRFADLVGAHVNLPAAVKRRICATESVRDRLRVVEDVLRESLGRVQVAHEVQQKVKVNLESRQREHYLRTQLKTIKQELGLEGDAEEEALELRDRIRESGMPEEAMEAATREVDRLAAMTPASSEYHVVRNYLGWLLDLPWDPGKLPKVNLNRARKILDRDHYGLDEVKQRILEFLAVRRLTKDAGSQVLCLSGPPGVGKTSLGKSIAEAMKRDFVRVSVGGMRDEAEIKGHRRTYVGAMPGKILQELKRCGSMAPVFCLDEIDKMGSDARGDPSAAMLEVLDPEQNHKFLDHYLDVPYDLSKVFFLCTANVLENIPPPLRDRMEIVTLSGYTPHEKFEIARRHVIPQVLKRNGLTGRQLAFTDEAVRTIIEGYTREAGVRSLKREIGRLCRGRALEVATGGQDVKKRALVDPKRIEATLGPRRFEPADRARNPQVGVTAGLAWTPVGGDLLLFEATLVPGKGGMRVTGRLGDVMRESCEAALSYVKSAAEQLDIDPTRFNEFDLHVHVPDGATPKDGPSAGVTIASCLASLYTGRPARADIAMTGEITLKGRVLAVGGIKEKVLAAHRAGITQVLLPNANAKDLPQIPEDVRETLRITLTSDASENIGAVLMPIFLPEGGTAEQAGALPPPPELPPEQRPSL
ncbi:MAG: endopeptidase La [Planctomycetota bacterium]|nr:endopeptidase La [Planctomycetota bacterium]